MFLHNFHPQSLLFAFGPFQIHWYGFLITLSVMISFFIARHLFKKYQLSLELLYNLSFYLIIFGVVGARLWHVLSEFDYYLSYPLDILKIWHGGLAIHGAILGGFLVILFYSYIKPVPTERERVEGSRPKHQLRDPSIHPAKAGFTRDRLLGFHLLLDIFAPLVALGLAFGRWGNYFNQELYGPPTASTWGIPIDLANRLAGFENFQFFQPIFLYESLWCLLLFGLLIYLHHLRLKSAVSCQLSAVSCYGFIFSIFLILYSLERFAIGFLRIDPQAIWLNLRLDQWVSLGLIVIGIVGIILVKRKPKGV